MLVHSGDTHFQVQQYQSEWGSSNVLPNLAAQTQFSHLLSPLTKSIDQSFGLDFSGSFREASPSSGIPVDDFPTTLPSLMGDDDESTLVNFSMSEEVSHNGLEPVPVHYESLTSFVSHADIHNIMCAIDAALNDIDGVDHEIVLEKNKIKGVWSGPEFNDRICRFLINFYQQGDNEILCEFQKRSGCSLVFNDFYQKVLQEIIEFVDRRAKFENETNEGVREWLKSFAGNDFMEDSALIPSDSSSEEIRALCDMSSCEALEAMQQRLSILASLSEEQLEGVDLTENGFFDDLVERIQESFHSSDQTIVDRACVFLSNLCTQEDLRDDVINRLLTDMFNILESPRSLLNRNSKRHIAKSLSLLSETHVSEIMESEKIQNYIYILRRCHTYENDYYESIGSTLSAIEQY